MSDPIYPMIDSIIQYEEYKLRHALVRSCPKGPATQD